MYATFLNYLFFYLQILRLFKCFRHVIEHKRKAHPARCAFDTHNYLCLFWNEPIFRYLCSIQKNYLTYGKNTDTCNPYGRITSTFRTYYRFVVGKPLLDYGRERNRNLLYHRFIPSQPNLLVDYTHQNLQSSKPFGQKDPIIHPTSQAAAAIKMFAMDTIWFQILVFLLMTSSSLSFSYLNKYSVTPIFAAICPSEVSVIL